MNLSNYRRLWRIAIPTMFIIILLSLTNLNAQVITIGTGTDTNTTTGAAPINIYFRSLRTQTVYTAAELNAAGFVGGGMINSLAYYVTDLPLHDLPDFQIRMRHTTATDASAHIDGPYEQVYFSTLYSPTAGDWDTLTLTTPFAWNGVDNILVDTAFTQVTAWNSSGQQRVFPSPDGMRFVRADGSDQSDAITTTTTAYKPQIQIGYTPADTYDDDMAAFQLVGPPNASPGVVSTYSLSVMNVGENTQSNYTVKLMKEGDIELDSVTITDPIEQFEMAAIDLEWSPDATDEGYIEIWGEVVLAGDENPDNNVSPAIEVFVGEAFEGNYVINHDGTGDFDSFNQAIDTISLVGVLGPVVFEVAPGTYDEQIVIPEIFGTSEVNSVTFTAMDDTEDTILTYTPTDTNTRYVVKFDGAKNIRFDNLTVEVGMGATHGWIMHVTNGSEDLEITNNHLSTIDDVTSTFFAGIIVSGSPTGATTTGNNVQSILIENNVIHGGYYGITLIGVSGNNTSNARIIGNEITDSYYYGMYLNWWDSVVITDNFIDMRSEGTTSTFCRGIHTLNGSGAFEIGRNQFINMGQYGIYMSSATAPIDDLGLIHNNMIGGGFTNTGTLTSGFYITTSHNIGIYYNSVNNDSQQGRTMYSLGSATGLHIMNNSFVFSGTGSGYASYHASSASIAAHDNNNYYTGTSPNFVYYGSDVADLAALQAVNVPAGNDQNSLAVDPLYVGDFDLDLDPASELIGAGIPVAGIDFDHYGNPRHPEFPSIGAHEIDLAGFGSLDGYVYDDATDLPLNGVHIQLDGTTYNATTNNDGYFNMPFVMNGSYDATATLFGYHVQTIEDVVIIENENTNITFNIEQLTNVTVTGQVVGSDYPTIGLSNVPVFMTGYEDYATETDTNGDFSITGVYINQTYNLTIAPDGYSTYTDQVAVGDVDLDLGVIIVDEIAYPPNTLIATQAPDESQVDLIWNSPLAIDYYFWDFEDGPDDWTSGAIAGSDHWELGTPAQAQINNAYSGDNAWMTRLTQNYDNNANTWLMSPELDFTSWQEVHFSAFLNIWCENNFDGMILEASTDGGVTWYHVRSDDTALDFYNNASTSGPLDPPKWSGRVVGTHGFWDEKLTEIPELAGESSVYLRFRFQTDGSVDGEGIAVDDVYIGPEPPDRMRYVNRSNLPRMNNTRNLLDDMRILEEYNVYRFLEDDLENEDNWVMLGTAADTTYSDLTWQDAASGYYHYAVKGVYTNDVLSEPAISNIVERDVFVTVSGQVVGSDYPDNGLEGVPVSLTGEHDYLVETDANGFFTIPSVYMFFTYNLSVNAEGYAHHSQEVMVSNEDVDLGVIIVDEVAYPPHSIVATQNVDDTEVDLIWNSPLAVSQNFWDFEDNDGDFVSSGPVNDWQWGVPTDPGGPTNAYSGQNVWATNLTGEFSASADSRLDSPAVNLPPGSEFVLEYYQFYDFGPPNWDGGNVKISTDNGNSWIVIHPETEYPTDAIATGAAGVGGEPGYVGILTDWELARFDLSDYAGNEVMIRWHFGSTAVVHHPGWFIDDVYIGPDIDLRETNVDFAQALVNENRLIREQRDQMRILEGYIVYRFNYDDIDDQSLWTELASVTDTTYTDLGWADLASGFYHYAVVSEHTNDVLSDPGISNWVGKDMTTNVAVNITTDTGDLIVGAEARLMYQDQDPDGNSPTYIELAVQDGDEVVALFLNVLRGTYDLEVSYPGFETYTQTNIDIQVPTDIDVELSEIPYPPSNLHYTAGSNIVNLMWNEPVPAVRNSVLDGEIAVYEELLANNLISKEEASNAIEDLMNDNRSQTRNSSRNQRDTRELLGYNVYRDSEQLNTDLILSTNYTDNDVVNNETYVYYVTAVYTLSESEPSNTITVIPGPQQLVIIGDGTASANTMPFNFFWRNSLSQTIYMQSEVNAAGLITELQYFSSFNSDLTNMPIKIWMAETTQDNLTADWIPAGQMELVFDGNVDFPSGENTISIELDEFFLYTGSDNLVIMANRPMDTQWHSSLDHFYYTETPDHPDRSRFQNSDSVDFDPYNPSAGTLISRVPNTGLNIISVGMGTLMGHVYYDNDDPVQGATVTVVDTPFQTQTDNQGYYFFPFVFEGEQTVVASLFGYYDDVVEDLEIIENETVTQDFVLTQLPTVTVTGRIVGSDQPDVGLADGLVIIEGYEYYESDTDAEGLFTIYGVYADHVYDMTVQRSGYQTTTIQIDVGDEDLDLGDVVVNELAFPAFNVIAELSADNTEVDVIWSSPDSYQYVDFRYDDGVPITAIGLPNGTQNSVLGAVHHRFGILESMTWYLSGATTHPTVNLFVFGLDTDGLPDHDDILYQVSDVPNVHGEWNQYEFDEELEAPGGFMIGVSAVGNLGIAADDGTGEPYEFQTNTHYYATDYSSGNWMTMESAGYMSNFLLRAQGFDMGPVRNTEPLPALSSYPSDMISVPVTAKSLRYSYDYSQQLRRNWDVRNDRPTDSDRILIGYIVYRLLAGEEEIPGNWDEVGTVTDTTYTDDGIPELLDGTYRYAVRSVYTNNVLSVPAFSNTFDYEENIPIIINLEAEVIDNHDVLLTWDWSNGPARSVNNNTRLMTERDSSDKHADRAFLGFKITRNGPVIAEGVMDLDYLDAELPAGNYTYTVIGEFTNGSTNMLTVDIEVTTSADDVSIEPLVTNLRGNRPNPFNPDTVIDYSLSQDGLVSIVIYNIKGQIIRTLVNEYREAGNYNIVWNGQDDRGRDAGSGIYFYRMKTGSYSSTKKMILMK